MLVYQHLLFIYPKTKFQILMTQSNFHDFMKISFVGTIQFLQHQTHQNQGYMV